MYMNVGRTDARIRGGLAVVFLILAGLLNGDPTASLVFAVLALVAGATALTHTCPIYRLLHASTRDHDAEPRHHTPH